MDDYFGFDRRFWDLKILATDISLNALRSAKNGIYTGMSSCTSTANDDSKFFFHNNPFFYPLFSVYRSSFTIHRLQVLFTLY